MERLIDASFIIQVALFMVGITQLLKQFFEVKNRKLKIVIAIIVGAVGGILLVYVPAWIFNTILGISVGVVFYDYILKWLEKWLSGENPRYTFPEKMPQKKNGYEK